MHLDRLDDYTLTLCYQDESIASGLSNRLYEKRKAAAYDLER